MDHRPLVVPPRQPAGGLEHPFGPHALRSGMVDDPVVEPGDCLVQLDDDQVLVVAFSGMTARPWMSRGVLDTVDIRRQQELVSVCRS